MSAHAVVLVPSDISSAAGSSQVPHDGFLSTPLGWLAAAATVGIVADRYCPLPFRLLLVAIIACLFVWLWRPSRFSRRTHFCWGLFIVSLLGAAYHQGWTQHRRADDISRLLSHESQPVTLIGLIAEVSSLNTPAGDELLRSRQREDRTAFLFETRALRRSGEWEACSGTLRVFTSQLPETLQVGDLIELHGRLSWPPAPANPGERDLKQVARDQWVRGYVFVPNEPGALRTLEPRYAWPLARMIAGLRSTLVKEIGQALPPSTVPVAAALLLAEGTPGTVEQLERYHRTGIYYVLAVSGQHFAVLAVFLAYVLPRLPTARFDQRRTTLVIGAWLLLYMALIGPRPSVIRPTAMWLAIIGAIFIDRQMRPTNALALPWLIILLACPTSIFEVGCLLSFLGAVSLTWALIHMTDEPPDSLDRLRMNNQPLFVRVFDHLWRVAKLAYLVTLVCWIANAPLIAARFHFCSPVAILLGPPLILLTSIALIAGFIVLAIGLICPPLTWLPGLFVSWPLALCDWLVQIGDRVSHGWFYLPAPPEWWLWGWYALICYQFLLFPAYRLNRRVLLGGAAWLFLGILVTLWRSPPSELRCTFLAVGHGGCTVLEVPDGRVLLYDVGSLGGPEVVRDQIAPFLWSRGIRNVDEVFLSHADLDHYNGLPALLQRFTVGLVTVGPSFEERSHPALKMSLNALKRAGIPLRTVKAGNALRAGPVLLRVLHPPIPEPQGNENTRSLVLLVEYEGQRLLLTGDIEGIGLERLLRLRPETVDVLMAPHHGSLAANTKELAAWAQPRVVVSCEGGEVLRRVRSDVWQERGVERFSTHLDGAVIVRFRGSELIVEPWRTKQRTIIPPRAGRIAQESGQRRQRFVYCLPDAQRIPFRRNEWGLTSSI